MIPLTGGGGRGGGEWGRLPFFKGGGGGGGRGMGSLFYWAGRGGGGGEGGSLIKAPLGRPPKRNSDAEQVHTTHAITFATALGGRSLR